MSLLSWPGLYNPSPELRHRPDSDPTPPGTNFITNANVVFEFTLFWTLIFTVPPFFLCGLWSFISLSTKVTPRLPKPGPTQKHQQSTQKHRARRLLGLLTFLLFSGYALAFAVVSSLVVGYGLALFYYVGGLNLSTWVPFCWGMIQGVVNILSLWPTFVDLI